MRPTSCRSTGTSAGPAAAVAVPVAGFQSGLSRVSVIHGPGAQPRVVLMGRLAVYGAGAARLHEEIIPVTAIWTEAERDRKPLRALGEAAKRGPSISSKSPAEARAAPPMPWRVIQPLVAADIADLVAGA